MKKILFYRILSIFLIFSIFSSQTHAILTLREEEIIGKRFLIEVKRKFEFIKDDFANHYIEELGNYLLRAVKTKPFSFHFYIINKDIINAFAAPGGNIFIFAGLIDLTESADELAAVISHEIGHVTARHLAYRLEKSKKLGILTVAGMLMGALVGGPAGSAIISGSMAASAQMELHYSRDDERQADELGFKYMIFSRFDPNAMLTVLKKITETSLYSLDKIPPYLLTHPTGPERMSNIKTMLGTYSPLPPTKEVLYFRKNFPLFKTIVHANSVDPNVGKKHYEDILKKDPSSPLANLGLGIIYMRTSEYKKAISHIKKALEMMPDSIPILINLGKVYQRCGRDVEAVNLFKKVLDIDDTNDSALFLLGVSYENMKRYKEAIDIFKRLSYFKPVKDEVYYHLGISYGKIGKLALAHYNFGIYFSRIYEINKAMFHFFKAKQLAKGDRRLLNEISSRLKDLNELKL